MFYLKELPPKEHLENLGTRYPNLNLSTLETFSLLLKTGSEAIRAFESSLGKQGLSQGKFLILLFLFLAPGGVMGPSELAERLGVTRATVTGLLDGLGRNGWIRRFPRGGDRRQIGVELTPAGGHRLEGVLPSYFRSVNVVMSKISREEQARLGELLEKVRRGLSFLHTG